MKIQEAIKEKTVVHCATEIEADRIIGMMKDYSQIMYVDFKRNSHWNNYKSETCYYLYNGTYCHFAYYKKLYYAIIESTEIEDEIDYSEKPNSIETALSTQIGGDHYKNLTIQPFEYCMKNNFNAGQTLVIRYITRYKDKNGLEDLLKAKHCIEMLIELEYGKQG